MKRKVLVTGGAGFIGGHVADAYLARGDDVWVIDDLSSGRRENVPDAAHFVSMSIGDPAVAGVFEEAGGFDVVNHHAAQIDVRVSVDDARRKTAINVDGFLNIIENARRHGTERVVFVSSGGVVYGEPELRPTPETAAKSPRSPYGVSKLAAEYYLNYYHAVHGVDYVALRYSNVYGPRQDPHGEAGVVAIFSKLLLSGSSFTIYGDGEQTRDYVYVGDVVSANMAASDAALPAGSSIDERAFNVGTGVATSVKDLAAALMGAAGRSVGVNHAPARAGELRDSSLDCARAERMLGWTPGVTLVEGLGETYSYIAGVEVNG